jgi:hypothetical protein
MPLNLQNRDAFPASPQQGDTVIKGGVLYRYDGTNWLDQDGVRKYRALLSLDGAGSVTVEKVLQDDLGDVTWTQQANNAQEVVLSDQGVDATYGIAANAMPRVGDGQGDGVQIFVTESYSGSLPQVRLEFYDESGTYVDASSTELDFYVELVKV